MSKFLSGIVASAFVAGWAASSSATILFDGSGSPAAAGYALSGNSLFSFDTPAAGTMSQTGSGPGEWFIDGATAAGELNSAVGWSVEWSRDNIQFGGGGNHVRVQDDDGYIAILSYVSGVEIYDGANTYYPLVGQFFPLSTGFHAFRLERAPGSATANFTIDGGVNGSVAVDATLTSVFDLGGPAVHWGSSANGAQADVVWDYFNVTQPVPEPSSLVLIGVGAVGLVGLIWTNRRRS